MHEPCRMTASTGPISAGKGERGDPVHEEQQDAMNCRECQPEPDRRYVELDRRKIQREVEHWIEKRLDPCHVHVALEAVGEPHEHVVRVVVTEVPVRILAHPPSERGRERDVDEQREQVGAPQDWLGRASVASTVSGGHGGMRREPSRDASHDFDGRHVTAQVLLWEVPQGPAEGHGECVQRCELKVGPAQVADAARCRDRAESHLAHVSGWMPRRQRIARIQRLIAEVCADVAADGTIDGDLTCAIRRYAGMAITRSCSPRNDGRPHQSHS